MTTTTRPDVPLPAGAHVVDDWDADGERLIATEPKQVDGTDVGVSIDAYQLPDGSLVNRPLSPQRVLVDQRSSHPDYEWADCLELSPEGACQLARALLQAASQLEGWAL